MTNKVQTRLADPPADSSALQLSARMQDSIAQAIAHITGELDELAVQINEVKQAVLADGALLKSAIGQHFELGAEALAFANLVRKRLVEQLPPAPQLVDFGSRPKDEDI
jgi:hypothetical protein